jgi:cell division protein FtsQ
MIRKIAAFLGVAVVLAYLAFAMTAFNVEPSDRLCNAVTLSIADSIDVGLFTASDLDSLLRQADAYPVGKSMRDIRLGEIEKIIGDYYLVDSAQCYKTPGGAVHVSITQRIPMVRVIAANGDNYYVDNTRKTLPPDARWAVDLPVITGVVDTTFARGDLYDFGVYVAQQPFWNAQIVQIHVLATHEIELIPRVGDHTVFLGSLRNFRRKLDNLRIFYEQGLNTVGWNKYRRINLDFDGQVIGIKREPTKK